MSQPADERPQAFRLDPPSRGLLGSTNEGILIGVLDISNGIIQLFVAAAVADPASRRFAGHRELIRAGLIHPESTNGFSVEIAQGRLRAFYRMSILNGNCDDFSISNDMMIEVMAVLNLQRAPDFRSFP